MKLKSARIKSYKCIIDSGEFSTGAVTCLVGKNESGKTALLQALYKLNPVVDADGKFKELEYPRNLWSDYKRRHETDPDRVVITKWELTDSEVTAVEQVFGPGSLKNRVVEISKGYDNCQYWSIPFDEGKIVAHMLAKAELTLEEAAECHKAKTVEQLKAVLTSCASPSEKHQAVLQSLSTLFPNSVGKALISILSPFLPRMLYFSEYYRLVGEIAIDALNNRKSQGTIDAGDRVFLALLDLAGTTSEQIQRIGEFEELVAELEAVSNRLSREIFEYWSQNRHLKVQFRFDAGRPQDPAPLNSGYVFRTRIENLRHGVTVPFSERSAGFVWFFSFLVWFSQVRRNYGQSLVILLDEPGLNLHARAQADLLRYINERLAPDFQVVYTTHSPFMIDPDNLLGVRTVEDQTGPGDKILGTKVGDQVLSTDADTVFPLQAALGYDMTQTAFVGKHTLLVEGPSDLLYLSWASQQLKQRGRKGIDQRWVIAPSGGIDKIASFVALFGGNKLHVAVLTDYQEGDKKKVRDLRESKLLKQGHFFSADMYTGAPEADVEDIFGRDFYVALVNECYHLPSGSQLPANPAAGAPIRAVKEVERHFATLPPSVPEFDHYQPASYLLEHGSHLQLPGTDAALDRFEKLFADLNGLLPAVKR